MNKEELNGNYAAVLCSSYDLIPDDYAWLSNKLMLQFDDVLDAHHSGAFSISMAIQIKDFIDRLPQATVLCICCDSGESRSAAIAAAVYRYLRKDEMIIWKDPHYQPNVLAYRLQCEAFHLPSHGFQSGAGNE